MGGLTTAKGRKTEDVGARASVSGRRIETLNAHRALLRKDARKRGRSPPAELRQAMTTAREHVSMRCGNTTLQSPTYLSGCADVESRRSTILPASNTCRSAQF